MFNNSRGVYSISYGGLMLSYLASVSAIVGGGAVFSDGSVLCWNVAPYRKSVPSKDLQAAPMILLIKILAANKAPLSCTASSALVK
jgi:hypothetical protein